MSSNLNAKNPKNSQQINSDQIRPKADEENVCQTDSNKYNDVDKIANNSSNNSSKQNKVERIREGKFFRS